MSTIYVTTYGAALTAADLSTTAYARMAALTALRRGLHTSLARPLPPTAMNAARAR